MAQTIVVQEQALNEAQRRIEELESELQGGQAGGGLLGGLFGKGGSGRRYGGAARSTATYEPWGPARGGGGGFLAGAAQTAMGVAGASCSATCWAACSRAIAPRLPTKARLDQIEADHGDVGADAGGDFGGDF